MMFQLATLPNISAVEAGIYFLVSFGVFIFLTYMVRSINNVPELLRNSQAQTHLLSKIAEKSGVDQEEISDILLKASK